MRKCLMMVFLVIVIFQLSFTPSIQAAPDLSVSAEHAVLMDAKSGRVLYEKKAYDPSLIASTTKIMTAIIAIESGKLDEKVKVSERAVRTEGSSIYLTEKEKIPLKDLVYGLMLRSGNDSAVAIAEHVGGSLEGFTYLMNQKAEWLGMNASHFENPHGLDGETHYSSAYDLALLMSYAMKNKTFREVTGSESYQSQNRDYPWKNKNKLLTMYYDAATGGKTGYTKKAGRSLVSSAEKNGMELVAVTLNAPDDWNDHQRMFEWGFDNFKTVQLQKQGAVEANGQRYYLPRDVFFPLTDEEQSALQSSFYRYSSPPIEQNVAGVREFMIGQTPLFKTAVLYNRPVGSVFTEYKNFLGQLLGVSPWST